MTHYQRIEALSFAMDPDHADARISHTDPTHATETEDCKCAFGRAVRGLKQMRAESRLAQRENAKRRRNVPCLTCHGGGCEECKGVGSVKHQKDLAYAEEHHR